MNLEKTIMSLADTAGVSGDETKAAELALSYLKNYTDDCYIKNGNVIGHLGVKGKKPHILIDAHIDQIGFVAPLGRLPGMPHSLRYSGQSPGAFCRWAKW